MVSECVKWGIGMNENKRTCPGAEEICLEECTVYYGQQPGLIAHEMASFIKAK